MHQAKINSAILLLLTLISSSVFAQTNTNSPYSYFGLGEVSTVSYGRNLGIGGTGFGVRNGSYLNHTNPASLTAIDSLAFLYETGLSLKFARQATNSMESDIYNLNLTHLTFGHRYTTWLMGSFGIQPVTNIGYRISTDKPVEGMPSESVYTILEGDGGLAKGFYSVGLKLTDYFSVGVEAAAIYGIISKSSLSIPSIAPGSSSLESVDQRFWGFSPKLGAQINIPFKNNSALILGGVYDPQTTLNGEEDIIRDQYYNGIVDSVEHLYEQPIMDEELPLEFGAGFSYTHKGRIMIAADYKQSNWGDTDITLNNQSIYSGGLELLPQSSLNFMERCSYRIGFRYDTGIMTQQSVDIKDWRVTLGYGMPLGRSKSMLNFTLESGQQGYTTSALTRERYAKFTVAFSLVDNWFMTRKIR